MWQRNLESLSTLNFLSRSYIFNLHEFIPGDVVIDTFISKTTSQNIQLLEEQICANLVKLKTKSPYNKNQFYIKDVTHYRSNTILNVNISQGW